MTWKTITPPDEDEILEFVTVAEVKANLRIVHSQSDSVISRCILQAFDYLDGPEGWLRRSILTATYRWTLPAFKQPKARVYADGSPYTDWIVTNTLEIPLGWVNRVDSIRYQNAAGGYTIPYDQTASPAIASTTFGISEGDPFWTVDLQPGNAWPSDVGPYNNALEIIVSAGLGTAAEARLKARGVCRALEVLAADYYQNPSDTYAEPRLVAVNRQTINGMKRAAGRYRIMNDHA